jgi:hypothetical protein
MRSVVERSAGHGIDVEVVTKEPGQNKFQAVVETIGV